MVQTYLTGWGAEIIPQRPNGQRTYIGRITNVSRTYKYVEYIPFYASIHKFWIKVPREFRHELVGADRVKVVKTHDGKFVFHSAWKEPELPEKSVEEEMEEFLALGGGY